MAPCSPNKSSQLATRNLWRILRRGHAAKDPYKVKVAKLRRCVEIEKNGCACEEHRPFPDACAIGRIPQIDRMFGIQARCKPALDGWRRVSIRACKGLRHVPGDEAIARRFNALLLVPAGCRLVSGEPFPDSEDGNEPPARYSVIQVRAFDCEVGYTVTRFKSRCERACAAASGHGGER
jgi:hypothetical protein